MNNAYAAVNSMPQSTIEAILQYMLCYDLPSGNPYLRIAKRGFKCYLKRTTGRGHRGYHQIDCNRWVPGAGKQLVHAIVWRWRHPGRLIPLGMELSHLDADPDYVETRLETHDENESRKYCHLFGWYKPLPGENKARCPHWEQPCRGP